ncbi:universal stress protein [Sphingorhabdus arenilitoris]|uniref:Universal stress protein n=1 Tax=Sphingorhabdus arenilitoris TaxID=1490041 RepID=A0ABV8RFL5_9SPHN
MKNILVNAGIDDQMESRLQVALDFAHRFDAHLTFVQAQPYQSVMGIDMFGGAHLIAEAMAASDSSMAEMRTKAEAKLAKEGVSWNWLEFIGQPAAVISDAARLCDLVIMSLGETGKSGQNSYRSLVGEVVFGTATPVLAVPAGVQSMQFDRAMVAYDGGAEAAAALKAAVPLLSIANDVRIAEIEEKESEFPITEASLYLSRHGINNEIETAFTKGSIEETLFDMASDWNADYLVMGAFGHSRLRETIFGGVTRYLMHETKIPLLLAH